MTHKVVKVIKRFLKIGKKSPYLEIPCHIKKKLWATNTSLKMTFDPPDTATYYSVHKGDIYVFTQCYCHTSFCICNQCSWYQYLIGVTSCLRAIQIQYAVLLNRNKLFVLEQLSKA